MMNMIDRIYWTASKYQTTNFIIKTCKNMWWTIVIVRNFFFIFSLPLIPAITKYYTSFSIPKGSFLIHCFRTTVYKIHVFLPGGCIWPFHQTYIIFSFNRNQLWRCHVIRWLILKTKHIVRGNYKSTTHNNIITHSP